MNKPPIALILFSNDLDHYLPMVEQERKVIEEALEHLNDSNRLKVIARSSVSIEEVFRLFNRYRGRIVLFHFAGHANGSGLQFNKNFREKETGKAVGLAELFAREAQEGSLQFVFLNGCRTAPQVENLRKAGVPSILATQWEIPDQKALELAQQLYRSLSNADQAQPFAMPPTTLQIAFDTALAFLKTKYDQQLKITRSAGRANIQIGHQEPWELFTTQGTWTLPFHIANEQKTFNELLIPRLIEAFQPFSKRARNCLLTAKTKEDWAFALTHSANAQELVASSFAGVLGNQLKRLIAIALDKESSYEKKQQDYLFNGLLTAKRSLQLLCFTLISKLWDEQKYQHHPLSPEQKRDLNNFFQTSLEPDIATYLDLLSRLYQIFKEHQLSFPLSELENFQAALADDSDFRKACQKLHNLDGQFRKSLFQPVDCFLVERHLTTMLTQLIFLRKYKMVSIKNIAYEGRRHQSPRYLHTLGALRGFEDHTGTKKTEEIKYLTPPTNSDAILLWKRINRKDLPKHPNAIALFNGYYMPIINLFPFIIDWNGLNDEGIPKIYFYSCRRIINNSLCYNFFFDNDIAYITYKDVINADVQTSEDWQKDMKLDTVYSQFHEAMKDILQTTDVGQDMDFDDDEDDF